MPINSTTAIVPFFNEGERVVNTLKLLSKVANLKEIICVDDGSTDSAYKKITKKSLRQNL